ncbi:MAG: carboxymuconolactone decarboxylase family protein [Methanothrix sp.]|uniref:carboxymuconolactone decarboxylase family protein n=1 Tax=Methanothrix sp. TaxID=90426 RepID=UPI00247D2DDE|nr:carboxymuconolactone decarboxylase family protein [Methanothrix sp.]
MKVAVSDRKVVDVQKTGADRFLDSADVRMSGTFRSLASAIMGDGALSAREKALIALACSVAIRCESCTRRHMEQARALGVTREEMLEAAAVASLIRMGSGLNAAAVILDEMQEAASKR